MFGWTPTPFQKFIIFVFILPFVFFVGCIKRAKEMFFG